MDFKKLSTEKLVNKSGISRYSLISGISKRAREISEKNEELGIHTDKKTVVTAAEEFERGEFDIVESAASED